MTQKLTHGQRTTQRLSQKLRFQLRVLEVARRNLPRFLRNCGAEKSGAIDWVESTMAFDERLTQILSLEGDSSVERRRAIVELVGNVGANGYLEVAPGEIALRAAVPVELVEELRAQLMDFESRAIGSLDFREFFLFQCSKPGLCEALAKAASIVRIEKNHGNLIQLLRFLRKKLASKLFDGVMECLRDGRLKMRPSTAGLSDAMESTMGAPDLLIDFDGGSWSIRTLPNGFGDVHLDEEIGDALRKRESLLLRMGEFLLENQKQFFLRGPAAAVPLEQAMAADRLSVARSTVSRAIGDKVVRTPHGLFKMEKFFSRSSLSPIAMDWFFSELFRENPSALLYGDGELGEELRKRFSIKITRRTVCRKRHSFLGKLP
ncbi:MAG: hypothetical protein LBB38_01815 [Puniceicoccales bacterium]|jgi:RNA polymerase sigma-54 factor|nr:hypothetical protein [Puniceicoccales bacterium]